MKNNKKIGKTFSITYTWSYEKVEPQKIMLIWVRYKIENDFFCCATAAAPNSCFQAFLIQ